MAAPASRDAMSQDERELFLEACRATGPLHVRVEGLEQPGLQERILHQPFALIGRAVDADIRLEQDEVSRRHAYLQVLGGRLFCLDLCSRTGIRWGEEARQSGWGDLGQKLEIGPYRIAVTAGVAASSDSAAFSDNPLVSLGPDEASLPDVSLELVAGVKQPSRWPMTCALAMVGRSSKCKVRLGGTTVGRFHCGLVRTPFGVWVIDLVSEAGILLNGRRVRWARLKEGNNLQVGKFILRLRFGPLPAEEAGRSNGLSSALVPWNPAPVPMAPGRTPSSASFASNQELIALATGFSLAQAPGAEALLAPLVQQFTQMQQQMFDQFQQVMTMIVQTFRTLHADQVGQVRQELRQLRQLTLELRKLQAESAKLGDTTPAPTGAPRAATPALPGVNHLALAHQETMIAALESCFSDGGTLSEASPGDADRPSPRKPGAAAAAFSPGPLTAEQSASSAAQPSDDIHAWFSGRLATIQDERQSRLQRIMSFLIAKRAENASL